MDDGIGLLVCGATPLMVLGLFVLIINCTLGPLMRKASVPAASSHFLLSDLLWLMIQLQLAMALTVAAFPASLPTRERVGVLVVLCLAVVVFWTAGLLAVSQAGIRNPARRAIVFLVLVPGTVLAIVGLPLLFLALLSLGRMHGDSAPRQLGNMALFLAGMALGLVALRWLAAWSVASQNPWKEVFTVGPLPLLTGGHSAAAAPPKRVSPRQFEN